MNSRSLQDNNSSKQEMVPFSVCTLVEVALHMAEQVVVEVGEVVEEDNIDLAWVLAM
jgi:hypothetical protein